MPSEPSTRTSSITGAMKRIMIMNRSLRVNFSPFLVTLSRMNLRYRNSPVRNAASEAQSATTISGSSKYASAAAVTVPTAAVIVLPVL